MDLAVSSLTAPLHWRGASEDAVLASRRPRTLASCQRSGSCVDPASRIDGAAPALEPRSPPKPATAALYHRAVTDAAPPSGPATNPGTAAARPDAAARPPRRRPRRPDAERQGPRPGRLVPLRLRQHDLQLRHRVDRDRALADRRLAVRARPRPARPGPDDRDQRRAQRPGLADPRRPQRPRWPAPPVPAVLHGLHDRALGGHRADARGRRRHPLHDRQLRLPGRAHLLRRDPLDGQLLVDPRQALGDRRRGRLHGHDLRGRHPAAPRHHRDAGPDLLHRRRAVRGLRDPDLPDRPRLAARHGRAEGDAQGLHRLVRPDPRDHRPRPDRARAAPLPARPVLLQRRGQHAHRRDERGRGEGRGAHPGPVADRVGDPDRRRHRGQLRLGLAGRPARAEEDADRGPRVVGRSASCSA